ncbi:Acetyltransferase (GNAT) family protein [Pilibacter termitis]|uniref:Acetyltransferase (GNAT) family protein n=1 Tax=Pilibacter termitis TaxID=263852 RepID=A0A1T4KQJ4_9ENTE|nr:GNAT family N-acetyltransferase [Pilibacter termitis]SJZ44618.1 Acetyltransferase (GNAT) family protein [Pilibacter termitis]
MLLHKIRHFLSEYKIEKITNDNFSKVFEIYSQNHDYFLLTQGSEATYEESIKDITALPPNCDLKQKQYFCLSQKNKIVAVVDVIESYPDPNTIWIGLLLIDKEQQGKNIGTKIVTGILSSAKLSGYKTVQLGVITNNLKALKFWEKQGFRSFRHHENIVVMAKELY